MSADADKITRDFAGKPTTQESFTAVDDFVTALGDVEREKKAQVSHRVNRKFLWMWAYGKTADGTLYLNVTLDRPVGDPRIHALTQTSAHCWNHQVEVKSREVATSDWLKDLIRQGHEFAAR